MALKLLAGANHSRALLHAKLVRRGFSETAATKACDQAMQAGYLDDRAFAEGLVRRRTEGSRWGKALIARELAAKGIAEEEIAHALGAMGQESSEETERALTLARTRLHGERPPTYHALVTRIGPYLQRRGYPARIIAAICRQVWSELQLK